MAAVAAAAAPAPEPAADEPSPAPSSFVPPSIDAKALATGASYSYFSPIPASLLAPDAPPCVLGVDEAGRGPVLGPMVYAVFFLPLTLADELLRAPAHRFDDSKVLTPAVRARLVGTLCTPASALNASCGWATTALSARDIAANMLRPAAAYNLNAQAVDATVDLIRAVYARGVNVHAIYVDTIGQPAPYQAKLQRLFPAAAVTVAKKADSLYPCVSAASVCAKVTRDAALEVLYTARRDAAEPPAPAMAWGSGYPSDARCVAWMKSNMHPVFGWGPECRFSWGTAKDMLDAKPGAVKVEWPLPDDGETSKLTDFFESATPEQSTVLGTWFGTSAGLEAF